MCEMGKNSFVLFVCFFCLVFSRTNNELSSWWFDSNQNYRKIQSVFFIIWKLKDSLMALESCWLPGYLYWNRSNSHFRCSLSLSSLMPSNFPSYFSVFLSVFVVNAKMSMCRIGSKTISPTLSQMSAKRRSQSMCMYL